LAAKLEDVAWAMLGDDEARAGKRESLYNAPTAWVCSHRSDGTECFACFSKRLPSWD
jgi:hypothetical protein